jgi:putative nucleotidyltransferase with HDIG domain
MLRTRPNWSRMDEISMEKELLPESSEILVIEDHQGRKTSYYPALVWNDLGCSIPQSRQTAQKSCIRTLVQREVRKISSAKCILRDIGRRYESSFQEYAIASEGCCLERHAFLNSNLLYLIAATDGNEDTVGHSQLVARYTILLTKALGIDDKNFSMDIERGALLHDVGKIGIPESILRKNGPLTVREREIVKEHPLLGYEMIEEFNFLRRASRVVLFHHESFDGLGYPYGLRGEEIPLEARIFAIADTVDAITSDRPYRKGQSFKKAFDEIEKGRGTQFDPYIVDAFFSVPEEKWQKVKSETERSLLMHIIH